MHSTLQPRCFLCLLHLVSSLAPRTLRHHLTVLLLHPCIPSDAPARPASCSSLSRTAHVHSLRRSAACAGSAHAGQTSQRTWNSPTTHEQPGQQHCFQILDSAQQATGSAGESQQQVFCAKKYTLTEGGDVCVCNLRRTWGCRTGLLALPAAARAPPAARQLPSPSLERAAPLDDVVLLSPCQAARKTLVPARRDGDVVFVAGELVGVRMRNACGLGRGWEEASQD